MRHAFGGGALALVALLTAPGCGDDFEPCKTCGNDDGSAEASAGSSGAGGSSGSAGSGGSSGSAGQGGSAGSGGSAGADGGDGGIPCDDAEDCVDTNPVCEPVTATCGPPQCTDKQPCPANQVCILQLITSGGSNGACYPACQIGGPPCGNGATCVPAGDATKGGCVPPGTEPAGAPCTASWTSITTGCVTGYKCALDGQTHACKGVCSAWDATVTCNDGKCFSGACIYGGDPAQIGQTCDVGSQGKPCGEDGTHWRGACLNLGSGEICFELCRASVPSDCPSGEYCVPPAPGTQIGVCV